MNAFQLATIFIVTFCCANSLFAQSEVKPGAAPDASVLNEKQWEQLDASVERGLAWLATQQQADGSFKTYRLGQPAVTSFCVMAFLSQGESPSNGKYPVSYTHLTLPTKA